MRCRMTRGTPCRSGIQKNSNPRKEAPSCWGETAEPAQMGLLRRHRRWNFPASWAAPEKTVLRPPASGRHTPSHPHSGTTVPHPDSAVSPLAQTTGPGVSADTHWRGRARPCRPEASQSRDGRLGHPCPKYLPSAICESGRKGPVVDTQAQHVQQPRMVHVVKEVLIQPLSGSHTVRIEVCDRGPHPMPPVRGDSRNCTPENPAHRWPLTASHRRVAPTCLPAREFRGPFRAVGF